MTDHHTDANERRTGAEAIAEVQSPESLLKDLHERAVEVAARLPESSHHYGQDLRVAVRSAAHKLVYLRGAVDILLDDGHFYRALRGDATSGLDDAGRSLVNSDLSFGKGNKTIKSGAKATTSDGFGEYARRQFAQGEVPLRSRPNTDDLYRQAKATVIGQVRQEVSDVFAQAEANLSDPAAVEAAKQKLIGDRVSSYVTWVDEKLQRIRELSAAGWAGAVAMGKRPGSTRPEVVDSETRLHAIRNLTDDIARARLYIDFDLDRYQGGVKTLSEMGFLTPETEVRAMLQAIADEYPDRLDAELRRLVDEQVEKYGVKPEPEGVNANSDIARRRAKLQADGDIYKALVRIQARMPEGPARDAYMSHLNAALRAKPTTTGQTSGHERYRERQRDDEV